MAELADAPDLGSGFFGSAGSTPVSGTTAPLAESGRRGGFKDRCLRASRFESGAGHHHLPCDLDSIAFALSSRTSPSRIRSSWVMAITSP